MYEDTLAAIADAAARKARLATDHRPAYLVHAGMAGAYVGLGIVMIFAIGTPLARAESPFTGLVMAGTFGIALSLVLLAGSDLFTGNTMILAVGTLRGRTTWRDLGRVYLWSWLGNLAGSALLAGLAVAGNVFASDASLVLTVAATKMHAPAGVLFVRAILCNWLVVLAVWSAFKLDSEVAKLAMIWWCLLAFIGSGYEHSVANMTLLTMANLIGGPSVSWAGMLHNLVPVTLGNIVSGALFMGAAYWFVTDTPEPQPEPTGDAAPTTTDD